MDPFSDIQYKNYFPSDVLKFMKQNASPRQTIKLMQICKYFQHENFPFVPLEAINIKKRMAYLYSKDEKLHCVYEMANIGRVSNDLWLKGSFKALSKTKYLSEIISKIAYSHIFQLDLRKQTITLNEFKFLTATGNIKTLFLENTTVTEKNGDKAALEEILKCVPNVEKITWHHKLPSFSSATNAGEILLPKLQKVKLIYNRNNFNLKTFRPFMINHGQSKFDLRTEKLVASRRLLSEDLLTDSDEDDL